jgi:hypothetical protein
LRLIIATIQTGSFQLPEIPKVRWVPRRQGQPLRPLRRVGVRLSAVLDETLLPVTEVDDSKDRRFIFIHPGKGTYHTVSAAASVSTDILVTIPGVSTADEYRNGFSVAADTWILYAGGPN